MTPTLTVKSCFQESDEMIRELYTKEYRAEITLETISFPTQQHLRITTFGETEQAAKLALRLNLKRSSPSSKLFTPRSLPLNIYVRTSLTPIHARNLQNG